MIAKALGEWGYPRVVASTLVENAASRRVMEKCGLENVEEFIYEEEQLPGEAGDERRGVRYAIDKPLRK